MPLTRLGLLGGTFDPIHVGHLILGRFVLERLALERVVFVPSAHPPHKATGDCTAFDHRLAMVRLATAGDGGFECDPCERQRAGPSYTVDTVAEFRRRLGPQAELFWILGADLLADLHTWHRLRALVESCTLVTLRRGGSDVGTLDHLRHLLDVTQIEHIRRGILQAPCLDISSSDLRGRVARGLTIRNLVPDAVRQYIADHRLYQGHPSAT